MNPTFTFILILFKIDEIIIQIPHKQSICTEERNMTSCPAGY